MRLAVYHPWVYLRGGAERVLAELVERSAHDWTVYTHHHDREATFDALRGPEVVELEPRVSVRRSLGPLVHAASTMLRAKLPERGEQALMVSSEGLGDLVAARCTVPLAAYCHTPLKILHDPNARRALAERSPAKALATTVLGAPFAAVDRRMWRRFEHVLVNSDEVRQRVLRGRLAADERVEVLHPGADLSRAGSPVRDAGAPPYLLVAGRVMWQKNIELAIDAFRLARQQGLTAELVVAGAVDAKSQDLLAALRQRAGDLPVRFEVDPEDGRLAELYANALALLYPPANEDWGIVPLEAMAAGTPVIAVDSGGPRESVAHEVNGWLLPPEPQAFADAAIRAAALPDDVRETMAQACRRRAAGYSWDAFVARVDDVMSAVAEQRPVRAAADA